MPNCSDLSVGCLKPEKAGNSAQLGIKQALGFGFVDFEGLLQIHPKLRASAEKPAKPLKRYPRLCCGYKG